MPQYKNKRKIPEGHPSGFLYSLFYISYLLLLSFTS